MSGQGYHLRAPWHHGFSDYYGVPFTNNECRSNLRGLGAETGCRRGAVGGPGDNCGPCPVFHFVNGTSAAGKEGRGAPGIVQQGDVDMVNIDRQYADVAARFVTTMAATKTPFLLYCRWSVRALVSALSFYPCAHLFSCHACVLME